MSSRVITPEAVLLELPTAGVATRAFARLIDIVLQLVVLSLLLSSMLITTAVGVSPVLVVLGAVLFVLLVLPIGLEIVWRGRSIGKAMLGLQVVGIDGSPEAPRQAAIRGIVALVDIYLSLGSIALGTAMFSESAQRVGDLAAGTVVIRVGGRSALRTPIAFHPPPGYAPYISTLDVGALRDDDFSLIREFLLRVKELTPTARVELATSLAEVTLERIHHVLPWQVDPELWLVCVASAYQQRQGGLLADAALGLAPLA